MYRYKMCVGKRDTRRDVRGRDRREGRYKKEHVCDSEDDKGKTEIYNEVGESVALRGWKGRAGETMWSKVDERKTMK